MPFINDILKNSNSVCSLLICESTVYFCMLALNFATLLSELLSSSFFFLFVDSIGLSTWTIVSSVNRVSFLSIQYRCLFFLFF